MIVRACGHTHLDQFHPSDITTWDKQMTELSKTQSLEIVIRNIKRMPVCLFHD